MRRSAALSRIFLKPSAAALSITVIVAIGAVVSKVAGLAKELTVAYELGVGPQLDAFLYSYTFPAFLIAVMVGGISGSFIPRYLATEADVSPQEARKLAGELGTIVATLTILLAAVSIPAFSRLIPLLAGGFDSATAALATRLVPVLCPLLIFSVFTSYWSSLLNAHRAFKVAAFVPVITPVVVLIALFGHIGSSGAMSLAIGTVAGGLLEAVILAACTRSTGLELFRLPRHWRPEYGQVIRQFLPAAGASLLMSLTMVVDQSFAANLPAGSVSALSYGTKLAAVGASILIVIVSTLSLPMFSRLAAERAYQPLLRAYYTAGALTLAVTVPIAATLAFGAEPILRILFMRGSFTDEDAALAASVQNAHAWHLVPYILSIVAVRALAAIAETWILLVGSFANLVVDLLVNYFFVPSYGVVAVGFAATAMYTTSAMILSLGFVLRVRGLMPAAT